MADTMDRRSEGPLSETASAIESRRKKSLFRSLGLCTYCGKTEVRNRSVCYSCSEKTQQIGERSAFKRHMVKNGIDRDQLLADLSAFPTTEIKKLISLL